MPVLGLCPEKADAKIMVFCHKLQKIIVFYNVIIKNRHQAYMAHLRLLFLHL